MSKEWPASIIGSLTVSDDGRCPYSLYLQLGFDYFAMMSSISWRRIVRTPLKLSSLLSLSRTEVNCGAVYLKGLLPQPTLDSILVVPTKLQLLKTRQSCWLVT